MAEIALKGNMKVKTLKAEFKKAFGSTLRVYKSESCKGAFADDDATLASIRAEGAKGGELAKFDDFDIDINKYKYLLETRLSGSLTEPYSAIALEEPVKE